MQLVEEPGILNILKHEGQSLTATKFSALNVSGALVIKH